MFAILCVSLICTLIYMYFNPCYSDYNIYRMKNEQPYILGIVAIVVLSAVVRIAMAMIFEGHETDINCFRAWSDMIYEGGFKNFYPSESFTDYPPGYMYVLYVVGWLRTIFRSSTLLVKLPAMAADILLGIGIYRLAQTRFSEKTSITLAAFALFSPVLILNSALWGQVDIIYTSLLVLFILLIYKGKMALSYYAFALAFFVKPQALIFTPVLLCAAWENVFKNTGARRIIQNILCGLGAVLMVVLLSIPFGITETVSQYIKTLSSYPYATVNAFNLYGAMGLNWEPLSSWVSVTGWAAIVLIVVYVFYEYVSGNKNWFFLAGVLAFATYMLSAKMHERYAFPAVAFFLMAYVMKPQKRSMSMFILASVSQLINTAWVLFVYETDINMYFKSPVIVLFSILNLLLLVYMIYSCRRSASEPRQQAEPGMSWKSSVVFKTKKSSKITKTDMVLMLTLSLVYGAISFYDLGDTRAPESWYDLAQSPVTVELQQPECIQKLAIYPSCNDLSESRSITVSYLDETGAGDAIVLDEQSVFAWNFIDFDKTVTNITFSTNNERLMIMEIGLVGENGLIGVGGNALFDEQHLVPDRATYKNGTYFDEIYHARTGYEFVHGFDVYEWTHPPLGKVFIAAGIKLFGMNPFGWRVIGNIFGILMVPLFYIMAKKFLGITHVAFLTTVLFTFDFMHFAQTRIATIDVYVTFFIMLMYLFMYRYYQSSYYDTPLKKTFVPLALTGLAFGFGAASKWTAIYACGGIAVIYFVTMMARYNEYYNLQSLGREKLPFYSSFIKSSVFCVLVFIVVPVIIYSLSYLPYLNTENTQGIKTIIDNQRDIFVYHSKTVLDSDHPFASRWYTWPVMVRPIWYYSGTVSETVKEGISSFGNPAVWWVGILAVVYNAYLAFIKHDRKAIYLLIGYMSCILPWIPVARTTYIYHYFPCVPFATLMIGHAFEVIGKKYPKTEKTVFALYAVVAVLLFVLFYPVLSGHGINVEFAEKFLKWFNTWVLI